MSALRSLDEDIQEVLFDEAALQRRVRELAAELERDYAGLRPLLVGMLRGSVYFLSDLSRALRIPHEIDFMAIAAYGTRHAATGAVRLLKDLDEEITDRHVVLVEDIVDTGLTLAYLVQMLKQRGPASVEVCALLNKPDTRKVDIEVKYCGFEVPPLFVVGYGLDFAEKYRQLPYVVALEEQERRVDET